MLANLKGSSMADPAVTNPDLPELPLVFDEFIPGSAAELPRKGHKLTRPTTHDSGKRPT